ncbi:DNA translocase FtsK [Sphingobacterium mizutaii NBRC 14946 = DSM 11724]|uniref:Stage III sporulation protein E n=2 Tax=Sphingobacterium mizutaii TaxID=1010 RepID=A0AAJ4XEX6_9SPHI|nr:DNA translocase FtsK [Sphingobacterium mizutaii]GEM69890.1 DNA translocase FtsK [Sphingobacterium mizutaii NBRC 14946 = DSM 11724]SDL65284.1 DNA segregation ATPase FtsK/SpoIIIE, S-DNA-T family [Sphingobacterium mizutaii]SNV55831.1 Stage III sporulation protein E [Sphingobacterium mizutaii]
MAKLNTFKNGSGSTGTKKTKNTTISYQKRAKTKSFDQFNFSEGQRKALKILGLFLLLLAGLFTVAFVSYLFTWQSDQSYIAQSNGGWSTLMQTTDEIHDETIETPIVQNKLGKFGALLANQFMYEWFGVASFLFILVLFVIGYKFLYKRSILPVWKTVIYSLVAIILLSITLGFAQDFISNTPHILEGKFGFWTNQILKNQIGTVGTGGLLVFIFLTALVLLYNYDLRFSFQSSKKQLEDEDEEFEEDDQNYSTVNNKIKTNTQQNIATDTYAVPDEEEDEIGSVEFTSNKEEETPVSLPLNVNAIKPNTNFVENQQKEIELSIEPPPAPAKKTEEAAEPALTVERVIEEKPISANDLVEKFGEYDPKLDLSGYQYPGLDLLKDYGSGKITINQQELEANKNRIVETLRNYSIEIEHIKATIGPTVTLYEIIPKPGVRISKIKNLEDDIALSLAALGIRIIAPMPGKGTIGIEVPSSTPEMVSMRSILTTEKFQKSDMDLPIALGKTISNEVYIADLAKMPHLLVAGATGQGKSVGINAILTSLLYKKHPAELKFVLVDPKKVELSLFKKIERHFLAKLPNEDEPIITDTKKVINTLNSLCIEMDQRYDLLKNAQVRNLKEYNAKFINRRLNPEEGHRFLPFIVLIIDEFADLIMTAGKEVETPIARLAQLARAVGIHLVIATQRPSVNIITGTIKANFPARLAFRVLSKTDSRTILDSGGADQLIGRGDMLLATGSDLIRIQCAFVDTPEVDQISDFIGSQRGYPSAHLLPEYIDENGEGSGLSDFDLSDRDQLFEEAARLIVMHQQGSTSLIQRKLKLGYNRAGRIIDQLEAAGIVGPFEGSKAREVLYPDEYSLEQYLETLRKD